MLLASLILTADLSLSLIHSTAHLFTYPSACISTCDFNVRFILLWVCWKQAVQGSYAAFIALHRAMLQQNKYETILRDPIPRYSMLFSRPFLSKTVMRQFQTCLMVQCRFAVAFYGSRASSQLVALVPQVFLSLTAA